MQELADKESYSYFRIFSIRHSEWIDLIIGLIGANSSFAGDVYLDNLILSQKDVSGYFVTITANTNRADKHTAKTKATE